MPKFTSNTGTPVLVHLDSGGSFYVDPDNPYETTDRRQLAALKASPSVDEVKEKKR